jgi:beta-phosphoglucomutase
MMRGSRAIGAVIFDLDGVLVDTAQFHLAAWQRIAGDFGFDFDRSVGESLKGVGRETALQIVMKAGGVRLDADQAARAAARKNRYYRRHLATLDSTALLPGALEGLHWLHERAVPVALASASKNARTILTATGIEPLFDAIIDGNSVRVAKPDPSVFLAAAEALATPPDDCVVFEDAIAGVQGALAAGCAVIGIGDPAVLTDAELVVPSLAAISWSELIPAGVDL